MVENLDTNLKMNNSITKMCKEVLFGSSKESNLKRENANINGDTAMGSMLQCGANTTKEFYLNTLIDPDIAKLHRDGWIHIHDLDFYGYTTTCTQIELRKLFKDGFDTGHGHIREPKSISSYAALAAIAIQSNQNDQHGGQSIIDFDYAMGDGVAISYNKYLQEGNDIFESLDDKTSDKNIWVKHYAMKKTIRETYQAMESLIHNLNTMQSRAGSQVAFSSINYGMDTSWSGRLAMEQMLLATEAGLGNGETPIFPIQIFRVKDGINFNEGEPNFDLFKLAIRVSAKRMFPNFSFVDAPYNLKYYKLGHPETEVGYMGCVRGDEKISISMYDKVCNDTPISTLYSKIESSNLFTLKKGGFLGSKYLDTERFNIKIRSEGKFVKLLGIMKNNKEISPAICNVLYIDDDNQKHTLHVTIDHPLYTNNGRKRADSLIPFVDCLYPPDKIEPYVVLSVTITDTQEETYDVETENDMFDLSGIISHNCRTRVLGNIYDPTREISNGRGNLSFTSINLVRCGIEAHHDIPKFYEILDGLLESTMKELLDRLEVQKKRLVRNFPFLMGQHIWMDSEKLSVNDELGEILNHGTLSIGFIGLAETLVALTGKHHGESEDSQKLGLEIISHIREFCDHKSQELNLNVTCLATPAEGLSERFIKLDKKKYGIIPGITDREYYTNSFHVPVYYKTNIRHKLEVEAPYHALTNAGHISYVELDGDTTKNPMALERVIRMMKELGIGYGAINHPIDRDSVCGYNGIINDICPCCGRSEHPVEFERIKRLH